jgi:hypothetical protein
MEGKKMSEPQHHEGKVLRINEYGLGIVEDQVSHQQFAFTFDKINGYRGEAPREIGLFVGVQVRFSATSDCQVTSIEVVKQ